MKSKYGEIKKANTHMFREFTFGQLCITFQFVLEFLDGLMGFSY